MFLQNICSTPWLKHPSAAVHHSREAFWLRSRLAHTSLCYRKVATYLALKRTLMKFFVAVLLDENKFQLAHITNETQLQKCNDIYSHSCQQTHMHHESFQMWIKTKSVCKSKFPDPEETWFGRGAARWIQLHSEDQTGSPSKGKGVGGRKNHLFIPEKKGGRKERN